MFDVNWLLLAVPFVLHNIFIENIVLDENYQ